MQYNAYFQALKKTITSLDFHKGAPQIDIEIWFDGVTPTYLEEKLYEDKIIKQEEKVNKLIEECNGNLTEKKKEKIEIQTRKIDDIRSENYKKYTEKYKIKDDIFYVKLVATKSKNVSKKFYIDDGQEISENDIKQLLPQLKVIPAIRDPKNESTAGANSYLKELIQMIDDEM